MFALPLRSYYYIHAKQPQIHSTPQMNHVILETLKRSIWIHILLARPLESMVKQWHKKRTAPFQHSRRSIKRRSLSKHTEKQGCDKELPLRKPPPEDLFR